MSDDRRHPDDHADDRRRPGSFEADMDSFDPEEFGGPLFGATTEQPVTSLEDELTAERISFGSDDSGALPALDRPADRRGAEDLGARTDREPDRRPRRVVVVRVRFGVRRPGGIARRGPEGPDR